jgi:uncharacterized protein YyaL (SSP411 family)
MQSPMRPVLSLSSALLALAFACPATGDAAATNRLAQEKSPYLRQHATNPVDWYPWGPEAFARARAEDKLIFLSVGYSTCHWCHVMERESFADPAVAAVLNANFVCVKVDREERPDVDRVYMTFLQATTGNGGWPMTLWLTPDLKPVFGGIYFPPESRAGQPGLPQIATRLAEKWNRNREELVDHAEEIFAALIEETRTLPPTAQLPDIAALRARGVARAVKEFDSQHGGFEGAPKFPNAVVLEFLLDEALTSRDARRREQSRDMAVRSLRALAAGGIHDQIGGGFHRYAVDRAWRVPHFEKMLVDQALLAPVLLATWQLTGETAFRDAAQRTLAYVAERLTHPAGALYTAEDADSPAADDDGTGAEGAYYVWTQGEIDGLVGADDAELVRYAFGVERDGNAGPHGDDALAGKNVLRREVADAQCAARFGLTAGAVHARLTAALEKLRAARDMRVRPPLDDKVLTSWNGLMISAFARAAQATGEAAYEVAASRAAAFLREHLRDPATGRLAHSFSAGARDSRGFAEDYAFLIQGLLDLYEASGETAWLEWAMQLQHLQDELFRDANGGYFHSATGDPEVPLRLATGNDGAEPSPNSIAIRNLARLAAILHRDDWREQAFALARTFAATLERDPWASPVMLTTLGWLADPPKQILIQGDPRDPRTAALRAEVWRRPLPRGVLLHVHGASRAWLDQHVSFIRSLPPDTDLAPIAYLCEDFICRMPTSDPRELARQLAARP